MTKVTKTPVKPRLSRRVPSGPKRKAVLAHHRHTGRLLPHAATSYPILVLIVLCAGVLMAGWSHLVSADVQDSYVVTATLPAPAPTTPATITIPLDGTHVTTKPITVRGDCPVLNGGSYVSLYRNMFYSGTAVCDVNGHYTLSTDLFDGANQLVARIYNFTDTPGPDSSPISVVYDPPQPPPVIAPTPTQTSPSAPATNPATPTAPTARRSDTSAVAADPAVPLTLSSDFTIRGYYVGDDVTLQVAVAGGTSPYGFMIDWGDGTSGTAQQATDGIVKLVHAYDQPGNYRGTYTIKITVRDASGTEAYLQQLIIVNSRAPSAVSGVLNAGQDASGAAGSGLAQTLGRYIWPSYGVVTLMVSSFWLGELRHANNLRSIKLHPKRPRHV